MWLCRAVSTNGLVPRCVEAEPKEKEGHAI